MKKHLRKLLKEKSYAEIVLEDMTTIYGYVVDVSGDTFTVYGPDDVYQEVEEGGGCVMTEFIHRCDLVMSMTTDIAHRIPGPNLEAFEFQRARREKAPKQTEAKKKRKSPKTPLTGRKG